MVAPRPAIDRVSRISSGAYPTEEIASEPKTGSAMRFGRRVCPRRSLRTGRPISNRLMASEKSDTGAHARPATPSQNPVTSRHVHFVIMGCGRVGATLAQSLEYRGYSVAVIDQNPEAFRRLDAEFGGKKVTGLGFDRETLVQAGIEDAYAFAAVSDGDNSNIIAARVVRETYGVDNVVARIYDWRRAEIYQRLGITLSLIH